MTHFEKARVCVLRRIPRVPQMELHSLDDIRELPVTIDLPVEFDYEVVAWPPGTVDGGLLPQVGDEITLPGYEQPFRVVERALHWPAPTTREAREGELQVNLAVEQVGTPTACNERPFGRPGERELQEEGRWLEGEVRYFDSQKTRAGRDMVNIRFDILGVGSLGWSMVRNWQAATLFPELTGLNSGTEDGFVVPAEVFAHLSLGQRFEVNVGPDRFGHTTIRDVRPLRPLEPGEEPNTRDDEVTANLWGEN